MINLNDIAQFLDCFFAVERYHDDPNGIYLPSTRPITRLGLALEPESRLTQWAIATQLDALFLHRPWQLQPGQLPPDLGILTYHLAFDENLTLGFNSQLATVLKMSNLEVLGEKQGRPIGMIGDISTQSFTNYYCELDKVFSGHDAVIVGYPNISRVAIVGAMTDALVREATARGANLYITGQLRKPAATAVIETGISVVAVGHRRCEEWGLQALAKLLRDHWSSLEVSIAP